MKRLNVVLLSVLLFTGCATQAPEPSSNLSLPTSANAPIQSQDVLFRALGLVGTPYVWGGNTPDSGFDCSGLITFVYNDVANMRLPRTTSEMIAMKAPTVKRNQWQSGDILFFATGKSRRVSHAGIYVGEGRFVHAPSSGGTVRLDSIENSYWNKAYLNAKRPLAVN
ncbi:C40 family peptidase [Pseudomonas sp. F1_0610]|uniref:C40 family peptidase n=1 Tax=Pseudomonas sp. F1_0610 TaxID=3114284 RepID=UPI0039C1AF89